MKPLNSGHLRIFKKLSVNERCSLLGGNLKKIVTFGTECFVHYSWNVRYWGCPLLGGFTVLIKLDRQKIKKILPTILETIISQIISQNFSTILRVCTGYHFSRRKLLMRAFWPPLTFRLVYVNNTHYGLLC